MGIGVSLVLVAAGAVLGYTGATEISGLGVQTVGMILMSLGAVGLVVSLLVSSGFSPLGRDLVHGRRQLR